MFHTPRWCLEVFFFVFFASYTDSFPVVFSFLFIFFLSFILLLFFSSGFHPILPLSFFTFLLLYFGFCSSLSFVFSFFSLSIQLFSSLSFSPFLFSGFPQFEFLLSFLSSDVCLISFPFFAFHLLFLTLSFSSPLLLSIFLYCSALLFPLSFAQLLFPLLLSFLPFSVYCFLFSVPFLSFPLLSCPFLSFPFSLQTVLLSSVNPVAAVHNKLSSSIHLSISFSFSITPSRDSCHWFSSTRSVKPINISSWRMKSIDNSPPPVVKNERPLVYY